MWKGIKRIARVLTDSLFKFAHFEESTDIRKNPSISLRTILTAVVLVPFLSCRSLLSYDRVSRKSWLKKLSGCTRKMVVSDSTISRVLHWLNPREVEKLLLRQFGSPGSRTWRPSAVRWLPYTMFPTWSVYQTVAAKDCEAINWLDE